MYELLSRRPRALVLDMVPREQGLGFDAGVETKDVALDSCDMGVGT